MNIIRGIHFTCGLWRVVAQTPSGDFLVITRPNRQEALEEAQLASPEPA